MNLFNENKLLHLLCGIDRGYTGKKRSAINLSILTYLSTQWLVRSIRKRKVDGSNTTVSKKFSIYYSR